MTSAYGAGANPTSDEVNANHRRLCAGILPLNTTLRDGVNVVVDFMADDDVAQAMVLLNEEIESGLSWPFDKKMNEQQFRSYFLSGAALVVRSNSLVVGAFYVKPNFPGRSSHYANGGFITRKDCRRKGIGLLMGKAYLKVAKCLGYRGAMFNLVYSSNTASIALWKKLKFTPIGTLPGVGNLKGLGYVDAQVMYFDLVGNSNRGQLDGKGALVLGLVVGFALGLLARSK